jgi:hypothetical protein
MARTSASMLVPARAARSLSRSRTLYPAIGENAARC